MSSLFDLPSPSSRGWKIKMRAPLPLSSPHAHNGICRDIFHEFCGKYITKYNYLGDVFIFLNLSLLFYVLGTCRLNLNMAIKILLITCFLYFLRGFIASLTICKADINTDFRPISGINDHYWYIISGHTLNALMISYLVVSSSIHPFIKGLSVILCVLVMLIQSSTREHYTCDIILTLLIVHLSVKAYV